MKNAYLILVNRATKKLYNAYINIGVDIIFISYKPPKYENDKIFYFSNDQLNLLSFYGMKLNTKVTVWDKAIYYLKHHLRKRRFYWIIEEDCFVNEIKFPKYTEELLNNDSDAIFFGRYRSYMNRKTRQWSYWKINTMSKVPFIQEKHLRACHNSLVRLSYKLIKNILKFHKQYNRFIYHGLLIPSLVSTYGLSKTNVINKHIICHSIHTFTSKLTSEKIYEHIIINPLPSWQSKISFFNNHIVDNIYVVSLKRDIYKYNILKTKLCKLRIRHERFNAVDGLNCIDEFNKELLKRDTREKNHLNILINKTITQRKGLFRSYGSYGILKTMIALLEDARKKEYKNIIVLQDDLYFHKNFIYLFNKYINKFVNDGSNIVWLGGNQPSWSWSNIIIQDTLYKPNNSTYGAYAVLINHNMFNPLIEKLEQKELPADAVLNRTAQNYDKCFVMYPGLIIPDVSYSSTGMKNRTNEEFYKARKIDTSLYDMSYNYTRTQSKIN